MAQHAEGGLLTRKSSSRVSSDRLVTRTEFSSRRRMLSPVSPPACRFRRLGGTHLQGHTTSLSVTCKRITEAWLSWNGKLE